MRVAARGENAVDDCDGAVDARGWIAGTYFHGLFDNDELRAVMLANLAARKGIARSTRARFDRGAAYDRLAQVARQNLNVALIYRLLRGLSF